MANEKNGRALHNIAHTYQVQKEEERQIKLLREFEELYKRLEAEANEGKFCLTVKHDSISDELVNYLLKDKHFKSSSDGVTRTISWRDSHK